jgi:hypothetical protein
MDRDIYEIKTSDVFAIKDSGDIILAKAPIERGS